ncbi:hypothetical protein PoB_007352100 [Plakobranchus ocellatus]|uniref:Uncharacterized protein n=1 Tax=Plakobranchus ocellatus TaxID=259542 RepID=A0AAV4DSE1_9GAST|nr:hypothetical protein PoB_007352100 [Plakobranchus ocellatus]
MKVTGHLKEPVLDPCPNRDDLQTLVDDTCAPAQCTRPRGGTDPGVDCCHFWNLKSQAVRPHSGYKCSSIPFPGHSVQMQETHNDMGQWLYALNYRDHDRHYESPVTDIRALRQTTVVPVMNGAPVAGAGIPVVPSNPGGVSEVTFPMTQSTLGQPDVTTACCVPVVPCQQGYQNLTPGIKRGALRCQQPPQPGRPHVQLGQKRLDPCVDNSDCIQKQQQQMQPSAAPQQYMMPPANQQGPGLPAAFPQNQQVE